MTATSHPYSQEAALTGTDRHQTDEDQPEPRLGTDFFLAEPPPEQTLGAPDSGGSDQRRLRFGEPHTPLSGIPDGIDNDEMSDRAKAAVATIRSRASEQRRRLTLPTLTPLRVAAAAAAGLGVLMVGLWVGWLAGSQRDPPSVIVEQSQPASADKGQSETAAAAPEPDATLDVGLLERLPRALPDPAAAFVGLCAQTADCSEALRLAAQLACETLRSLPGVAPDAALGHAQTLFVERIGLLAASEHQPYRAWRLINAAGRDEMASIVTSTLATLERCTPQQG